MFRKIKSKFILLSMCALFVLLSAIIISMNLMNYHSIVKDADELLGIMAENSGTFPDIKKFPLPPFMSPETPYEARYFSVVLDENQKMLNSDISRINAVDVEKAYGYALEIAGGRQDRGFIEKYRFIRQEETDSLRITFLDCGVRLYAFEAFLKISVLIGVAGYLVFFAVIVFFSGRIMKPVAESYEKQRRFITDAGHEIKTPLAIIHADVEVLELELGENEWLQDIQKQSGRLAALTNDLVYLSRMEEEEKELLMIEFPFSDVVRETAASFQSVALTQKKILQISIPQMLSLKGNEKAIRQLVNILLDNALKYSPENGMICIDVKEQGKGVQMTVFNTTREPVPKEKLPLLFERFYRLDTSRSTTTGGYGIGLSVAKAIVNAHSGRISATSAGDCSIQINVWLPL